MQGRDAGFAEWWAGGGAALSWPSGEIGPEAARAAADRLAETLREIGAGPGVPVGISLDPSPELVLAVSAVLLAGAVPVPIDPGYPAARRAMMARAAGVEVGVVERDRLTEGEDTTSMQVLVAADGSVVRDGAEPAAAAELADAAYVLFTSGSTGEPRGVVMPTRGFRAMVEWQVAAHPALGAEGRTLQFAASSFDVFFQELGATWMEGGTLVVPSRRTRRDPYELAAYLAAQEVSRLFLPYVALQALAAALRGPRCRPARSASGVHGRRRRGRARDRRGRRRRGLPRAAGPDRRALLRGGRYALVSLGRSGAARARRHLLLPGRDDDQVKVRGFRIELAEVDAALCDHPAVAIGAAAVVPGAGGTKRLEAFVEPAAGTVDETELRRFLGTRLPEQMIPVAVHVVDRVPRTPSGKLDRRRLPAMRPATPAPVTEPGPAGPLAVVTALIEQDTHARADPASGFVANGGDSLLAMRIVGELRRASMAAGVTDLLEAPSLTAFAARLRGASAAGGEPVPNGTPGSGAPASAAEEALWLQHRATGGAELTLVHVWRVEGELDPAALEAAIGEFIATHDALRTGFRLDGHRLLRSVAPVEHGGRPVIGDRRGPGEPDELAAAAAREPFSSERAPLLRITFAGAGTRVQHCVLAVHHLVWDARSSEILAAQLPSPYARARAGKGGAATPHGMRYADYVARLRSGPDRKVAAEAIAEEILPALPRQAPTRPSSAAGRRIAFSIDAGRLAGALAVGEQHGATPAMVALAAYGSALRVAGLARDDVVVGVPFSTRLDPELADIVGCFVNLVPIRLPLPEAGGLGAAVREARRATLNGLGRHDVPFNLVARAVRRRTRADVLPPRFGFGFERADTPDIPLEGGTLRGVDADPGICNLELTLQAWRDGGGLRGHLEYNLELHDDSRAAEVVAAFVRGLAES